MALNEGAAMHGRDKDKRDEDKKKEMSVGGDGTDGVFEGILVDGT